MNVLPVLELLRQKIGLNPESIGAETVEKAVLANMEIAGAASIDDYIRRVNESAAELNRLIESVVIPETSFFRNKTPFLALKDYLKRFVLNKIPGRTLRVLCLPCSTGEEAYSIAMVLLDLKLPANRFRIFAGDISEHVLEFARNALYRPYSFRGDDLEFRHKYFTRQDDAYALKQDVRDAVRFECVNILSDNFLAGHQPYDIIFCRNLLIYFDDATKEKAIKALTSRLAEDGVLFVGHAEGAKIPQFGYASLDYPMSFAFARKAYAEKINDALHGRNPAMQNTPPPMSFSAPPAALSSAPGGHQSFSRKISPVSTQADSAGELEMAEKRNQIDDALGKARDLAAEGEFNEVMALCEGLLATGVESAEVYYLLGQAVEASGNNLMAEEYLKKAIYLNADFYDALIHLSALYARSGNAEKAAAFSKRAQRVKSRNA